MKELRRFRDNGNDEWTEIAPGADLFTMDDRDCGHGPASGCPLINQSRADVDEEFGPLENLDSIHVKEVRA